VDKGWMDFPEVGCVKGIKIRKYRRIKKFKRIRIQPCVVNILLRFLIYFLGGVKDFFKILDH
jgi:hypothetical protein